jgi:hypothetical protein
MRPHPMRCTPLRQPTDHAVDGCQKTPFASRRRTDVRSRTGRPKQYEKQYGLVFGLTALGIAVGAQLNRAALRRFSVRTLLRAALWFQLGAGIVLLACAGTTHVFVLIPPLWLIIASLGFIGSNAAAIAMSKTGPYAGTGSAMIGVLQFGCAFAVSGLIAAAPNGTPYPMAIAIVTAALAANILWFLGSRHGNR